jgi:hypothetical protein
VQHENARQTRDAEEKEAGKGRVVMSKRTQPPPRPHARQAVVRRACWLSPEKESAPQPKREKAHATGLDNAANRVKPTRPTKRFRAPPVY